MASSVEPTSRHKAAVEKDGEEYVVVLIEPDGNRTYYVKTGVDEDGEVYPMVTGTLQKAKRFGLERSAKTVAGDMYAFLNREFMHHPSWI